ncbi:Small RNA 2'-O-methyltransferase [Eumeta japonica]|uniref:Small RNA 2'-O-methyltransferase n=1 Tax=Eumeta variegata TaxID=151549 RepID=A0A4C2A608_EUMVA|nr:Small RNA 2'-O-methyltransferase [Eumeta japonica]
MVTKMRQLRKMLHIDNREFKDADIQVPLWNNINWGENAPYWNQYYKIVREYKYPIEANSEEQRILDVITEEISKHVDLQDQNDNFDCRTEIPIEQIMWAVEHITQDVDKIKELLEWNGYQIVDNVVIHTRSVLDNSHVSHDGDYSQETPTDVKPTKIFVL